MHHSAPAPEPHDRARSLGDAARVPRAPARMTWRSLAVTTALTERRQPIDLPPAALDLPEVAGHVHDASCPVQSARGRLPRDAWTYLVEGLWQVCRRADFPEAITSVTLLLEDRHVRPDAMTAWLLLGTAGELDRTAIADVANGPEVVAAVREALRVMATWQAAAN